MFCEAILLFKLLQNENANPALKLVYIQTISAIILLGVAPVLLGVEFGLSLALGAFIFALPNVYFYRWVFAHGGSEAVKQIVRSLYVGEIIKFMLVAALFAVALCLSWVEPVAVFVGYLLNSSMIWFVPLMRGIRSL